MDFSTMEVNEFFAKTKERLTLGELVFEPYETVVYAKDVQVLTMNENIRQINTRGGSQNRLVSYDRSSNYVTIQMEKEIINQNDFAVLEQALLTKNGITSISLRNETILDNNGHGSLQKLPSGGIIVYENGKKIPCSLVGRNFSCGASKAGARVEVDYIYSTPAEARYEVRGDLINTAFSLNLRTVVRDEFSGQMVSGVYYFPHAVFTGGVAFTMGATGAPTKGVFTFRAERPSDCPNMPLYHFSILKEHIL